MTAPLDDTYLAAQSEAQRATDYPYAAPEGAFVLNAGRLAALDDPALLAGRTAVLSVGSNRAPVQLRRKFGDDAIVPVTPAILHDCDIVHAATVSYYGAVSCTAFPSRGTDVMLNVAWLDAAQLAIMHRTEAVGVAYDYVRMLTGTVTHLPVPNAGGDIVAAAQPVFGYTARSGVLDLGAGQPGGLSRIPARNRQVPTLAQDSAASLVQAFIVGADPALDLGNDRDRFIQRVTGDKSCRLAVNEHLRGRAIPADGPWKVQMVDPEDIAAFL
ncbi:MAG: hypothetical protein VXZ67_07700 [Pseudomonadota bacterium]|nr:hypothetical protein [Pseudomonadota bacterium]